MSSDTAEMAVVDGAGELATATLADAPNTPAPRSPSSPGSEVPRRAGLVCAAPCGPGADGRGARLLAGAVGLAPDRARGGRGRGRGVRRGAGAQRLRPGRRDERLRLAGQPAGGPRGALGRGVVPGDRPLRLPPRTRFLRHRLASGLLPALPARCTRDLRSWAPRRSPRGWRSRWWRWRRRCTGSTA